MCEYVRVYIKAGATYSAPCQVRSALDNREAERNIVSRNSPEFLAPRNFRIQRIFAHHNSRFFQHESPQPDKNLSKIAHEERRRDLLRLIQQEERDNRREMASAVQAGTTSAGKRSAKEDNRSSSEASDSEDESSSAPTHRPVSTPMLALKVAGACVYACVCVVLTSLYAVFVLVCANVSLCLHVCNFSGLLYVHVERNH